MEARAALGCLLLIYGAIAAFWLTVAYAVLHFVFKWW